MNKLSYFFGKLEIEPYFEVYLAAVRSIIQKADQKIEFSIAQVLESKKQIKKKIDQMEKFCDKMFQPRMKSLN